MANAKDFNIPITASDKTKTAFKSVKAGLLSIKNAATGTAGKLVALAGVGGFGLLIKSSLDAADALGKTADKIGITTESLQAMQYATSLFTSAGGPALSEALTKASKRLGEFNANGGGAASVWLKKLNLDTQQLATLSPDKLFEAYAESIRGLNDRGQQLAAISALMGDESRQLIGLVDAGADVFANAAKELDAFGVSISRVDAAKIEMANDSWTKTQTLIGGIGTELAKALAPALQYINNLIVDVAKQSGGMGNFVQKAMVKMVEAIGWVLDIVNGLKVAWLFLKGTIAEVIAISIDKINDLFKPLRALVGVMNELGAEIDTTLLDTMSFAADSFKRSADEMLQAAKEAANAPPPSGKFKEGWKEQVLIFNQAAESAGRLREEQEKIKKIQEGFEPTPIAKPKADGSAKDKIKDISTQVDALRQAGKSELEILNETYTERKTFLENADTEQFQNTAERFLLLEQLRTRHEQNVTDIAQAAADERHQLEENERRAKIAITQQSLSNLSALMSSGSKRLFEIGKRAAIANALLSAHESIVHSYNAGSKIGGPILGAVFATTAAIATALQVQKIRSQSFAGGGSNPSAGGGGGGGIGAGNATPTPPPRPGVGESKRTNITILGADPNQFVSTQAIAQAFKEAADSDEIVINFSGQRAEIS